VVDNAERGIATPLGVGDDANREKVVNLFQAAALANDFSVERIETLAAGPEFGGEPRFCQIGLGGGHNLLQGTGVGFRPFPKLPCGARGTLPVPNSENSNLPTRCEWRPFRDGVQWEHKYQAFRGRCAVVCPAGETQSCACCEGDRRVLRRPRARREPWQEAF